MALCNRITSFRRHMWGFQFLPPVVTCSLGLYYSWCRADAMICHPVDRWGSGGTKLLGLQIFSWTAANGSRTEAIPRLPGSSILMCMDNQQCQVCALTCTLNIFQTRCSLWRAASSLAEGHSTKRSHFTNVIKHAPLLSWCLDLRLCGMSHRDRWFDNVWQREDRRPKANFMLKFDSSGVMSFSRFQRFPQQLSLSHLWVTTNLPTERLSISEKQLNQSKNKEYLLLKQSLFVSSVNPADKELWNSQPHVNFIRPLRSL